MRKIIYTISTGKHANFKPSTVSAPGGWHYRRITDIDCPKCLDSKQKAAWAKINGPMLFNDYECSLCLDDDMRVVKDPYSLFSNCDIAALEHSRVRTLEDDFKVISSVRKFCSKEVVDEERKLYRLHGIKNPPLWLSGVLFRKHTDTIKQLTGEWAYWYSMSPTRRDQPSLAVSLYMLGMRPQHYSQSTIRSYIRHDIKKSDREKTRERVSECN